MIGILALREFSFHFFHIFFHLFIALWWFSIFTKFVRFLYKRILIYTCYSIVYSDVYSICVAFPDPLADRLYSETKLFLENHVKSQLDEFNCYMNDMNDSESGENQLLHKYYSAWKNYSQGLEYLNYLYL